LQSATCSIARLASPVSEQRMRDTFEAMDQVLPARRSRRIQSGDLGRLLLIKLNTIGVLIYRVKGVF
jgi:hypothetical protein